MECGRMSFPNFKRYSLKRRLQMFAVVFDCCIRHCILPSMRSLAIRLKEAMRRMHPYIRSKGLLVVMINDRQDKIYERNTQMHKDANDVSKMNQ